MRYWITLPILLICGGLVLYPVVFLVSESLNIGEPGVFPPESLGLDKTLGTLAPGYKADIIAVAGNPLDDISVLRNVTFVMKDGQIYKH